MDRNQQPPPPPYPAHLPSPLDFKHRRAPITETTLQGIRDPGRLVDLVEAFGEFDEAQGKEGLERRNEYAREVIRKKIAQRALDTEAGAEAIEEEKREEESVDAAMDVDVDDNEGGKGEHIGMLPIEEGKSMMEEGKIDIKIQNDDEKVGNGDDGTADGDQGEGEGEKPKKKKNKKKKKSKAKSPSSNINTGGDASWAKGRGMSQEMEVEELGIVEEEISVAEEVVNEVPASFKVKSASNVKQPSPNSNSNQQPPTIDPQSPISTISNESIDIAQPQKKKKGKNRPHKHRTKRVPGKTDTERLEIIEETKIAIIDQLHNMPEGDTPPTPESVKEALESPPPGSPPKTTKRLDITKPYKKELDIQEAKTQREFLNPFQLAAVKAIKKSTPPGLRRLTNGKFAKARPAETPAKRLDFRKIEMDVRPEQREIVMEDLVQIKRDKGKVDQREMKDPESYILATEIEPAFLTGKGIEAEAEAEPVETEQPVDLVDQESVGIVLLSPITKENIIQRPKSAPPTSSAWTLLKEGNRPEKYVVPIDKIPIVMDILRNGTITSTPKLEPVTATTSTPTINIEPAEEALVDDPSTPDVPLGLTFTASPADHIPDDRYDGPPIVTFGDLHFVNKTAFKQTNPGASNEITDSAVDAVKINDPVGNLTLLAPPNESSDTPPVGSGVAATDSARMERWNALANDSDSDNETIHGDPSPSDSQSLQVKSDQSTVPLAAPAIIQSPNYDTPFEHDLITPHDKYSPAFPKQSYPKSPLNGNASRVSSYRTASVNVSSPLANTTTTAPREDDELVPTRKNTPDQDITPTQSDFGFSPPPRKFESVDSSMEIGMPSEVDISNPMSIDGLMMDKAYTLYFTKSAAKEPSPTGVSPKVYPPLGVVDVTQYTGGLVPVFTAQTFGDFFGSWMVLRRKIAEVVQRSIEPPNEGMLVHGTQGLGLNLFKSDKTAHFFMKDVRPAWEDPMCTGGGKIVICANPVELDYSFLHTALNLVSGFFDNSCPPPPGTDLQVLGAVLINRQASRPRLDIWLGGKSKVSIEWANSVKEMLKSEYPKAEVYQYKPHYNSSGVIPSGHGHGLRKK